MLGVDAGQPVVRRSQHAVEGAGCDGAGCVGRVRRLRLPEAPGSSGASPPAGKGKRMPATGAGVFAGSCPGISTPPLSSLSLQRQTSPSQMFMVPAQIKFCVCVYVKQLCLEMCVKHAVCFL